MNTSSRIIYFDSTDRVSGTSSNFNIVYNLPNNNYDKIALLSCSIPKSYYNVTIYNNTFTLKENTTSVLITLPVGSYNKNNMIIKLTSLLNSASPNGLTYSITYPNNQIEADTFKYTFTSSNALISSSFIFTKSIALILGFENGTFPFTSGVLESKYAINFNKPYLYIKTDLCPTATDSILQEIYTSAMDQTFISYNQIAVHDNCKDFQGGSDNICSISIVDKDGVLVDLNGKNWVCSMLVFNKDDTNDMIKNDIILRNLDSVSVHTTDMNPNV